jgi:Fe2+ transport system protein B
MALSIEYLNHHTRYLSNRYHRYFNAVFIGYLIAVIWDRTRKIHYRFSYEWHFNSVMHIVFALVICLKISIYVSLFKVTSKYKNFFIALIFNVLGLVNEFFQNILCQRSFFILIADAKKDLLMNGVGTLLFLIGMYGLKKLGDVEIMPQNREGV